MFCRQRMLCNRAVQLFAAAKRARDLCIPWNIAQPRFGLLRRDTHFPMASIAASLPGQSKFAWGEEAGQQMIDVPSHPGSSCVVRGVDQAAEEESSKGRSTTCGAYLASTTTRTSPLRALWDRAQVRHWPPRPGWT